MIVPEASRLLTIASGFDRRQVDELTARAWAWALDGHSYAASEAAVVAHFKDPATRSTYLDVGKVLDRLERQSRSRPQDIAADVRSARARKLIDRSWPEREPLPAEVQVQLQMARERDRENVIRLGLEA